MRSGSRPEINNVKRLKSDITQTVRLLLADITPRIVRPAPIGLARDSRTFGRAEMPFLRPISDRYFEDYIEGEVHCFGTIAVEADEIVAFANRFDLQTLHTDPEAAKSGPFGGLIASGWHTAGLMTRLFMDHYLTKVASLGSPGGDELRTDRVSPGRTGLTQRAMQALVAGILAAAAISWSLDQADEAYKLFDTQTTGKGVFLM